MKIASVQIPNTTEVNKNFNSIMSSLKKIEDEKVDIVLFPECALSGFSAEMKKCTTEVLEKYIDELNIWSIKNNTMLIIPTAVSLKDDIYNSGFILSRDSRERFYKLELTESEKRFFSIPEQRSAKIFNYLGLRFGILVCMEAQMDPWRFFSAGDVDFVLWPGYWGWTKDCEWKPTKSDSSENKVFRNSDNWKVPLIQSNFSRNELDNARKSGPEGLSVIVNAKNQIVARGGHMLDEIIISEVNKNEIKEVNRILLQ